MSRLSLPYVTASILVLAGCSSESVKDDGASLGAPDGAAEAAAPYPPPAPDDCITDVTPGSQQLTCEGLTFDLTVPESCLTQACGLITDVHGFGMNSVLMNTHSRMQEIAGPKGYIVLQPSAPGMILQSSWSADNDDQVFALMQRVMNVWHVDRKRIHFDGYSMGGWMTWRFICKHADIIASAAPIAAGLQANGSCPFTGADMPSREVPISL